MVHPVDPVTAARRTYDTARARLHDAERLLLAAVVRASPSREAAAKAMDLSPRQLSRKLAAHGLTVRDLRGE